MKKHWFSSLGVALSLATMPLQAIETTDRSDHLKALLQELFSDQLLEGLAEQAIADENREIDTGLLIEQFRNEMLSGPIWTELAKPYDLFSDEEIKGLAAMFTSPLYQKFTTEGVSSMLANLETIQNVLATLAQTAKTAGPEIKIETTSPIIEVTSENFSSVVEQSPMPMIIDVYATWCPPCKRLAPILEKASERYPEIRFVKINVDTEAEIAISFDVRQLPTLLFLLPGESVPSLRSTGLMTEAALDAKIAEFQKLFQ